MSDRNFLVARMDASGRLDPDASDAIVPWWSFTKTALAIAALQLVEKRYLQLDDHINGCPFTLRQLLQHRAEFQTTVIWLLTGMLLSEAWSLGA